MKAKKKFWVVYWTDKNGYTEFVELWSTEQQAQQASEKYEESWDHTLAYSYEEIELIK